MEIIKKLKGNNRPQKIVIDIKDITFDFTLYKTHVVIIVDEIEKFNVYAEILIATKNQKNKFVVDFPICGNNISVKIEKNYKQSLIVRIEDIE
jgi:hypothetical protein